jgi:sulfite exporter TauE/SafE
MSDIIVSPLLLGLSTGIYCFVTCIPFIAPVMVTEHRNQRENLRVLLKFILGRLAGYLAFGAAAGYAGQRFAGFNFELVATIALAILSLLLILHAVGLWKERRNTFCASIRCFNPELPFVMGLLLGVNACPPFLLSLTYVLTLQSTLKGIVYFFVFFLGTSVYFVPVFFLGYLNRLKEFQIVGRISAFVVGLLFLGFSVYSLLEM